MDPVALNGTALAAGAALGTKDTASSAVTDAYAGLKALVRKRLAARPDGEFVLARHEAAPGTWQAPLEAELAAAAADSDEALLAAARAVMSLVDEAGSAAGKYSVDARGAYGVQVGERNSQRIVVNMPPGGLEPKTRFGPVGDAGSVPDHVSSYSVRVRAARGTDTGTGRPLSTEGLPREVPYGG
jgi:hypothetical protein